MVCRDWIGRHPRAYGTFGNMRKICFHHPHPSMSGWMHFNYTSESLFTFFRVSIYFFRIAPMCLPPNPFYPI